MSRTPSALAGSRQYEDGWRAINELIRSGGSFSGRERKVVYRNLGNGKFADASFVSGLDFDSDGRAFAVIDLDGDGALDLLLKNRTAPQLRAMRNALGGRSLILELRGAGKSNRDAVGARATLVTSRGSRIREVASGSGYLSQSSRRLHFGLADGEEARSLRIRWPGGAEQTVERIPARGTYRLVEGGSSLEQVIRVVHEPRSEEVRPVVERPWLTERVPAPMVKPGSRWTLLNFSATWCPPCRVEMADWSAASARLRAAGVAIQSVDVDDPARQEMVATYALLFRHLFDSRREMGLPMTFLIDQAGAIAKIYQGVAASAEVLADVSSKQNPALPFEGRRILAAPGRNWNELATSLAEHGLARPARLLFETGVQRGDRSAELRNNYAALLAESGDRVAAERMLRSLADRPEALVNLGLLYMRSGRAADAVGVLEKATRLMSDDGAAWAALGMARSMAGDRAKAVEALERAQSLGMAGADQANELGILYAESGAPEKARMQFERAVKADPKHVASLVNMASYYWRAGDAASAREWIEKAKAVDAGNQSIQELDREVPRR